MAVQDRFTENYSKDIVEVLLYPPTHDIRGVEEGVVGTENSPVTGPSTQNDLVTFGPPNVVCIFTVDEICEKQNDNQSSGLNTNHYQHL